MPERRISNFLQNGNNHPLVQIGFDSVKYIQNQSDYYCFHFVLNLPVTIIKHKLAYGFIFKFGFTPNLVPNAIDSNKALVPYLEKGESNVS